MAARSRSAGPFLAHRLWGKGYNAEMKRLMLAHALGFVERVLFRVGADNVVSLGARWLPVRK